MAKIYLIYNEQNGKKYVGQTTNCIAQRFCQHIDAAFRLAEKKNNDFYREIKASGENVFNVFKCSLLEECKDSEKDQREMFYIQKIKPEYNEVFKYQFLFSIKDRIIEEYNNGLTITELRIKYKCRHPFISNLLKSNGIKIQKSRNCFSKKVYLFKEDGTIEKEWANVGMCSQELGIDRGNIRICCIQNTKENVLYFTAKGKHFKYNKDVPKNMYKIIEIKNNNIITFKTKEAFINFFASMFPKKHILYGQLVRDRKTVYGYKIEKLYQHRN